MSRSIAFAFPGQGSQRQGMLAAVPEVPGFDRLLDAAEAVSELPLRRFDAEGTDVELADTRVAQPLLFLADLAWARALEARGVTPALVAGHSLGEIAALAFAGVLSDEAGVQLVVTRSRLMAEAAATTEGGMAAVLGMDADDIASAIQGVTGVWMANDNAPGQVVLSGTAAGIEGATKALSEVGARRIVPLKVAGAFHSPLMTHAAEEFRAVLAATEFADARFPIVQNADPRPTREAGVIKERLMGQIVSPVRWTETMAAMRTAGIDTLVECGPGAVLKGLARRVEGLQAYAVEDAGVDKLAEEVAQ